jgi:hypothetical protein
MYFLAISPISTGSAPIENTIGNYPGWALAAYAERMALIRICGS